MADCLENKLYLFNVRILGFRRGVVDGVKTFVHLRGGHELLQLEMTDRRSFESTKLKLAKWLLVK